MYKVIVGDTLFAAKTCVIENCRTTSNAAKSWALGAAMLPSWSRVLVAEQRSQCESNLYEINMSLTTLNLPNCLSCGALTLACAGRVPIGRADRGMPRQFLSTPCSTQQPD